MLSAIVIKGKIRTLAGDVTQKEVFYLIKPALMPSTKKLGIKGGYDRHLLLGG